MLTAEERVQRAEPVLLPEIVVLITTIPKRWPSLERVLTALANQTRRPDRIFLRLDGYQNDWPEELLKKRRELLAAGIDDVVFDYSGDDIDDPPPPRGAGWRWRHEAFETLYGSSILFTIDDDLVPAPDFIERTAKLVQVENCVVTWHGWDIGPNNEWPHGAYFQEAPYDINCTSLGTGVAAYRWSWLLHLWHHDLAQIAMYAGPHCDDDALLSVYLYENGIRVLRPKGRAPVQETEQSKATDASFRVFGNYRQGQRIALCLGMGVPITNAVFPIHRRALQGFNETIEAIHTKGLGVEFNSRTLCWRAVINSHQFKELGGCPHADMILPALDALPAHSVVFSLGIGRWTDWVAAYCAVRKIRFVSFTTVPAIADRAHKIYGHEIRIGDSFSPQLDEHWTGEREPDLLIVGPNRRGDYPGAVNLHPSPTLEKLR